GEDGGDTLQIGRAVRAAAAIGADLEILADAEIGEDAAALRHLDEAARDDGGGRGAGDLAAGEFYASRARPKQPGEHVVERRLAGAVAAQHRDDLALGDGEVDA